MDLPPHIPADELRPWRALSPTRAADFMVCPLRYRFRVIDRLPELPSPAAVRGTLVHAVLERLFDLPAAQRTLDAANLLVQPEWHRMCTSAPELEAMIETGGGELATWLADAEALLQTWFQLEDPTRLEPAERELYVEVNLPAPPPDAAAHLDVQPLLLRGYIDRLDVSEDGRMRVVDYKTGRAPSEAFEPKALFQLKCYALALWRLRGQIPAVLQLVYLGSGEVLRYEPDDRDLLATERKLWALWTAIDIATSTQDWRPSPGRICDWCQHRSLCPAWGGTPPAIPRDAGPAGGDRSGSPRPRSTMRDC